MNAAGGRKLAGYYWGLNNLTCQAYKPLHDETSPRNTQIMPLVSGKLVWVTLGYYGHDLVDTTSVATTCAPPRLDNTLTGVTGGSGI